MEVKKVYTLGLDEEDLSFFDNLDLYQLTTDVTEAELIFVWVTSLDDLSSMIDNLDAAVRLRKKFFITSPGYIEELLPLYHLGLDYTESQTAIEALRFLLVTDIVCNLVGTHCQSPVEEMFWDAARFRVRGLWPQVEVGPYRVDFGLESINVAIEIDGHDYHKTKQQRTRDAERQRYLEVNGWRVIRFTGTEVYKDAYKCVDETIAIISKWLSNESSKAIES